LIGGSVIHSFPYKPSCINRKSVLLLLSKIRDFRNRIYHNEPICFNGVSVDFTYASQIKDSLFDILEWMDPDIKKYVRLFDSINQKIKRYNAKAPPNPFSKATTKIHSKTGLTIMTVVSAVKVLLFPFFPEIKYNLKTAVKLQCGIK
jgi:membrane protein insertase Oxa1/YidC/SpoIIIJ